MLVRVRLRTCPVLSCVRERAPVVVVLALVRPVRIERRQLLVVVRVVVNMPPSLSVVRVTELVPLSWSRWLRSRVASVVPRVPSRLLSRPNVQTTLTSLVWRTCCSL